MKAAPEITPAMTVAEFHEAAAIGDASMSGHETARDARLPRIPDKWKTDRYKFVWIDGYLNELRNRLEHEHE